MKVTGYTLKEQIRVRMLELDTLYAQLEDQVLAFPGEDKDPVARADEVMTIESEVVQLQVAQKFYNLNNAVIVPQIGSVPLEYVIKIVGPTARVAKRWRSASKPEVSNYNRRSSVRKLDEIHEERTVSESECLELAKVLEKKAARMRSVIATANAIEMEIDWLDDSLFD